ncbi:alpha/beta hydrolase [Nonomuraea sp. NPDC048916]|uniref:alpha/beta hydrolase n=1 Tax=Nonomuraea sp. NPDC048916 TaxID=3154232 RepID=UPI0033E79FAF
MRVLARWTVRLLTGLGVLALAPVLGLATLAGTAMLGAGPDVFTATGLAVFGAVFFVGLLRCVPRPSVSWGRWTRAVAVLAVEAVVVWQVTAALTLPPPLEAPPPPVAGQREWRLETGSRLAYARVAPKRVTRAEPVVFLHGGPGRADLAGDSAFYGRLADDGYQVYVYDQLGAGRSARLADPREYGLGRDTADLEAVRQAVGAERLILIGHGHGARLAAAYLAAHPDRVARVVFADPASLDSPAGDRAAALLGPAGSGARLPSTRMLAVYTLLRADPAAAHAFAGDRELDAWLPRPAEPPCGAIPPSTATPAPSSASPSAPTSAPIRTPASAPSSAALSGLGGYAHLAARPLPRSVRPGLAGLSVPALVVKGDCDEQSWSSAVDYRAALPGSRLVHLDGSGRGRPYLNVLRAFLTGKPVRAYTAGTPPPGYRGPR